MGLTNEQHTVLLRPLAGTRVLKRTQNDKQLSYLTQHDVRAHLNRIFGFGNFDVRTMQSEIVYAERISEEDQRWTVGCRALVEVYIHATNALYSDVAFAEAINPRRGEATDQALKSAVSDAMKRACANLGDQFGLSLYNNGSLRPVVRQSLVVPPVIDDDDEEEGNGDPQLDDDATGQADDREDGTAAPADSSEDTTVTDTVPDAADIDEPDPIDTDAQQGSEAWR